MPDISHWRLLNNQSTVAGLSGCMPRDATARATLWVAYFVRDKFLNAK